MSMTDKIVLSREIFHVAIGHLGYMGGGLMLLHILAVGMDAESYGRLILGLTGVTLANLTFSAGTTSAIVRFFSTAKKLRITHEYFRVSRRMVISNQLRIGLTGLVICLYLVLTKGDVWVPIVIASTLYSAVNAYQVSIKALLDGARKRGLSSLFHGIEPWLKVAAMQILLIYGYTPEASNVLFIYTLCSLGIVLPGILIASRVVREAASEVNSLPLASKSFEHKMQTYARPYGKFGLVAWTHQSADRWSLELLSGTSSVAAYSVLYQACYSPVAITGNFICNLIEPGLYSNSVNPSIQGGIANTKYKIRLIVIIGILFTCAGTLFTLVFGSTLLRLIAGPAYESLGMFVPVIFCAGAFHAIGQIASLSLTTQHKTGMLSRVKIMSAAFGTALGIFGVIYAGMGGLIGAQLLSSLVYLAAIALIGLR